MSSAPSAPWLPGLLRLLERRTGLVLGLRGAAQLEEIFTQLVEHSSQSGLELLEHLRAEPQALEWEALLEAATISETHFYRVLPQMLALETEILPELLRRPIHLPRSLRIWSAGCSSGEEAYTLAFLLEEGAARLGVPHKANLATVLGTDLSPHILKLAQRGRYGKWSFRGTPAAWREKYFQPLEEEHSRLAQWPQWEVLPRLCKRVEFGVYNLVEPPKAQEPAFDLIVCRNVTIYFRPEVAQAVYRHLTSKLGPGGYLLLGPSDPPPLPSSELEQRSTPGAFFWQKALDKPRERQISASWTKRRLGESGTFRASPRLGESGTYRESKHLPGLSAKSASMAPVQPAPSRVMPTPKQISPPINPPVNSPVNLPLEPESTLLEQGLERLERGEGAAALELLRKSAYADPNNAFTHFLLGRVWLSLNSPVRARAALLHAQSLLVPLAPETPLASAPDLTALDLRHALERLLLTLDAPNSR